MTSVRATVEIGHTYSPERLAELALGDQGDFYSPVLGRYFNDTPEAAKQRAVASELGDSVVRVALLDDVAVRQEEGSSSDKARWVLFRTIAEESVALATGVDRGNLYKEADFERAARDLIEEITRMELPDGYRLSRDARKLIIGSGPHRKSISLRGFKGVDDESYPSCELLDLAWLQKRLSLAPYAFTILPKELAPQQERVAILAALVGIDPNSFETIFV